MNAMKSAIRRFWHKRQMLSFYSQFIKAGDLCFDLGANIGQYTDIFLKLGAKVVSVEPQQACLLILQQKFGNRDNVVIVGEAVGESVGHGELMICENAPTISTMSSKWENEGRFAGQYKWTKRMGVSVTTLDKLILTYGLPVFCKIDVEGYELEVVKGLSRPIPLVSLEFTREFFEDARKCLERLRSIGDIEVNCMLGESMKFICARFIPPQELYRRIAGFDDKPLLWGDIFVKSVI